VLEKKNKKTPRGENREELEEKRSHVSRIDSI
jgi:hypothetical protein